MRGCRGMWGMRGCRGGHVWLPGGVHGCWGWACMVSGGVGMRGCLGGVRGCQGGMHGWGGCVWLLGGMHGCRGVHRIRQDTVNEWAVRILLE